MEHGNPAINNLIREKTYLRWETSLGGQEYFWEKLTFAVTGKNAKQNLVGLPQSYTEDSVLNSRNSITTGNNHLRVRRGTSTLITSQTSNTSKYGTIDNAG